jgi:putrescine:ornithine antiporter
MESAAQNSDAVENPKKTVPLACMLGTLGAAVIYILSTTVIQGIVPNADLAKSSAPFATVYAQMFNPTIGKIIMALAVIACLGSLLGWQFTLAQTAKYTADGKYFPKFFSKVSGLGAPIGGLIVNGVLQTVMAFSTMSPNATAQFNKLVNLAAVTNLVPYVTSLSGLLIIMHKVKSDRRLFDRNVVVLMVAMAYSIFAIYSSGQEAVFGALITMAIGYVIFAFIANRFDDLMNVPSTDTAT